MLIADQHALSHYVTQDTSGKNRKHARTWEATQLPGNIALLEESLRRANVFSRPDTRYSCEVKGIYLTRCDRHSTILGLVKSPTAKANASSYACFRRTWTWCCAIASTGYDITILAIQIVRWVPSGVLYLLHVMIGHQSHVPAHNA